MDFRRQFELFLLPGFQIVVVLVAMWIAGKEIDLLYSSIWFDKIMHTLGGAGACVLIFWWIANWSSSLRWSILRFGLPIAGSLAGLIIGVGWELAEEFIPAMTDYITQSRWDTTFDVVFDFIGESSAGEIYTSRWRWQF